MIRNIQTKRIKITSRGFVNTSRGRCRTPITTPYRESINVILTMLSRDNATIVEVLDNGDEVILNEFNFNQDNSKAPIVIDNPTAVEHVPHIVHNDIPTTEKVDEASEETIDEAAEPAARLTRKQRREMERKARQQAATQINSNESVTDDTTVDDSAISE